MSERIIKASDLHEALKLDVGQILSKYSDMPSEEILAIVSIIVGMVLALQDQRTMTRERALQIVMRNIEVGNARMIEQSLGNTKGEA